jgi:hypothetical protein
MSPDGLRSAPQVEFMALGIESSTVSLKTSTILAAKPAKLFEMSQLQNLGSGLILGQALNSTTHKLMSK